MNVFTKEFTKKVLKETKLFSVIWRDNPMFAARRLGIVFSLFARPVTASRFK